MTTLPVIVERGATRVFASAVDWPGWCRSARDEPGALAALIEYAPRYAKVAGRLGFRAPADPLGLRVVERLAGNATTDFGAPGARAKLDVAPMGEAELVRVTALLRAVWRAFDAGAAKAKGRTLATGPRGGGRTLDRIVDHVRDAELAYLSGLGSPYRAEHREAKAERDAIVRALTASAHGEIAPKGPRGGVRWKPRFFVRRAAWHVLDHLWEIEDRSS